MSDAIRRMAEQLANLPRVPRRIWVNPKLAAGLKAAVPTDSTLPPSALGLEVHETDIVKSWAIEMSDGSLQLPEEELEGDG